MSKQKFKTVLKKIGSWTIAPAPFDTFEIFGTRKHVRVKGTIDKYQFSGFSLMPMGDGTHFLTVKAEIRKAIRKQAGDIVEIVLEKDNSELKIPTELIEALQASDEAKQIFDAYSSSHKRNYVRYIEQSKRKETREKRAVDTVIALEKIYFERMGKL